MKSSLTRVVGTCDSVLRATLAALMTLLVVCISWQVVSRYFLQDPSSWTEELARFALIWAGLLGAVYAYRTRAHVGIDILAGKLSPSGRRKLDVISALSVIAFSIPVIVIGGSNLVMLTAELEQTSAALGVSVSWVYAVIPLSGALLTLYAIYNLAHPSGQLPDHHEAAE